MEVDEGDEVVEIAKKRDGWIVEGDQKLGETLPTVEVERQEEGGGRESREKIGDKKINNQIA